MFITHFGSIILRDLVMEQSTESPTTQSMVAQENPFSYWSFITRFSIIDLKILVVYNLFIDHVQMIRVLKHQYFIVW